MARVAIKAALDDAGIPPGEIEAVFAANALAGLITGQESVRGQVFLQDTQLPGVPIFNVENACASGLSALALARLAIDSGRHGIVLVLGLEKMSHVDRARPLRALDGALDVEVESSLVGEARAHSTFMEIYAAKARRHMERFGSTQHEMAQIVVKNRRHAAENPIALFREPTTVAEVLGGRVIVDPLTVGMCSRVSDAAAAVVVTARGGRWSNPIRLASVAVVSGGVDASASGRAARLAYDEAGIEPSDIGLAEVHDATASAEIEAYETLGFAAEGEGHVLAASQATALGGRLPVNTSGGLLCRGHPVGATGVLQIVELVTQLRGCAGRRQVSPAPRYGLAHNEGGFVNGDAAAAAVAICAAL